MKQVILFLILLPLASFAKSNRGTSSTDGQLRTEPGSRYIYGSNFMGVELLGRGFLYSINFDRAINSRLSLGLGASYYQFNLIGVNFDIALLPVYMNYYFGAGTHRGFITAGGNITYVKAERFDAYYIDPSTSRHDNEIVDAYSKEQGTYLDPSAGVGYEYRARAGFTVRGTAYGSIIGGQFYRWYGATLGTHF